MRSGYAIELMCHDLWSPEWVFKDPAILKRYTVAADSGVMPFVDPRPYAEFGFELTVSEELSRLYGLVSGKDKCSCCGCGEQETGKRGKVPAEPKMRSYCRGYLESREDANYRLSDLGYAYQLQHLTVAQILEHHGFDFSTPVALFCLEVVASLDPLAEKQGVNARRLTYLYVVRSPQDVLYLPDHRCLRLGSLHKPHSVGNELLSEKFLKLSRYDRCFVWGWAAFEGRLISPHEPVQVPRGAHLVRPILLLPRRIESSK